MKESFKEIDGYDLVPDLPELGPDDDSTVLTGVPELEDDCPLPRAQKPRVLSTPELPDSLEALINEITAADVPLDVVDGGAPLAQGEMLIEPGVIIDLSDLDGGQESRPDEATTHGVVISIAEIQERVSTPTRRGILGLLGRVAAGIASIAGSRS